MKTANKLQRVSQITTRQTNGQSDYRVTGQRPTPRTDRQTDGESS